MTSNKIIYYESLNCKVKYTINSFWDDEFKIKELVDIQREKQYCYSSDEYIKKFIEAIKENIIRNLPCLNKVEFKLGTIDKDNMWHRFIITTIDMLHKILKIERKINYYKSIFVIICYENKEVFLGSLNFDGIE